jgi:hypothetical protein
MEFESVWLVSSYNILFIIFDSFTPDDSYEILFAVIFNYFNIVWSYDGIFVFVDILYYFWISFFFN